MRRTILLLAAVLALGASGALAKSAFPQRIALPDGFAPEGIEVGNGNKVYVGSVGTGAVWAGDLRTGTGGVIIEGAANVRAATGIEYDRGRLWVAGARFGNLRVYDVKTRAQLREYQLAAGAAPTFINDLVVTKKTVWLTDSMRPVLYKVSLSGNGRPGAATTVELKGEYQHVAGFNLNGIVATADGKTLIAVQTASKRLYTIDPTTGAAKVIDLGGYDLANGDGLLLHGRTLYVVQNQNDKVAVFRLSTDLTKATFVQALTTSDPALLSVPTTIDRKGGKLYVVNARFGRTTAADQRFWITRLR